MGVHNYYRLATNVSRDFAKIAYPVRQRSIEYNDNRLSIYCVQKGRCAITKQILKIGKMHCHHKIPVNQGGKDDYNNLILLTDEVHILLHSVEDNVIKHYMDILKFNRSQLVKLNKLRKSIGLDVIQ